MHDVRRSKEVEVGIAHVWLLIYTARGVGSRNTTKKVYISPELAYNELYIEKIV